VSRDLIRVEGQTGLTSTGWELANLTEDQWNDAGAILVKVDQARQWWLGDWWNACKWGDGKSTCEELGINLENAKNCGVVSKSFERSLRNDNLTFSHHKACTPLDIEMRVKFLDLAEEESWTVSFTRQKVQNYLAMSDWAETERQRRFDVESGLTVVANINKDGDTNLVNWAKQQGVYVFIGRGQFELGWGNPYDLDKDGNREEVCDAHINYFQYKKGLHNKLAKLKGKVLGCYCYPARCHGDYLVKLVNEDKG